MKASQQQIEWLGRVSKMVSEHFPEARYLNQATGPNGSILEFWQMGGKCGLLIFQYWKDGGFEYYCQGYENRMQDIPAGIRYMLGMSKAA